MKKNIPLILFLLIFPSFVSAFDHNHAVYDQLLKEIVVPHGYQTDVDYRKLKKNPENLDRYISAITSVSSNDFQDWNKDQQLAFLINAYNAFTLNLIVMHYPEISSIRDLGGFVFSSPWKKQFFKLFGKDSSLDYIEHDLIRKDFNEPRIHFAINCASRGCPPLLPDAYIAERLEQQLEYATRQFMRDTERNRFNIDTNRLEISSIFTWFRTDFEKTSGTIEKFIAPYITDDPQINKLIVNRAVSVKFLDYDWSLNDEN